MLFEQSKRSPGEETDRDLAGARAIFDAAAATTTEPAKIHRGAAAILFAQGMRVEGEERARLLREALEKFLSSEALEAGTGAYRAACVYARLGEEEECRNWLEKSREPGILVTRDELAEESHFDDVRQHDWFQALIAEPVLR